MSSENNINNVGIACAGCEACASICPVKAISMERNEEGFLYPHLNDKCIECGKCRKVCPVLNKQHVTNKHKECFVAVTKDRIIYKFTASGGVFTTFAQACIKDSSDYFICGAAWQENHVRHIVTNNRKGLRQIANSKYVQSEIGDTFLQVLSLLNKGKHVLFSGTPCQVAAIKRLTNNHENLITIDLVCHGVPSPVYFHKGIRYYSKKVKNVVFRWKSLINQKGIYFLVLQSGHSGRKVISSFADPYFKMFLKNQTFRYSCYQCPYACLERSGDVTIGDCDSGRYYTSFHPNLSKSVILINTEKGSRFWKKYENLFDHIDLDISREAEMNTPLREPEKMPEERTWLYEDVNKLNYGELIMKYGRQDSGVKCLLLKLIDLLSF